uniref:Uncharacterized protein n=1 Tax=Anguilla anguilla TaxID=7936 RepID=A0A0E9PB10_ANGAN
MFGVLYINSRRSCSNIG